MATTRILTQQCLADLVTAVGLDAVLDDLIDRLRVALGSHDADAIETMPRDGFRYTKPDLGLIEWMPAMVLGSTVSIKTVGYHPTNPSERGVPTIMSTTSLHDTTDGRLLALCDSTLLTALRTGAASAIVSDILAIENATTLGVIGCGAQAVTQIHAISRVRPIDRVDAYDADPGVSATLHRRLTSAGVDVAVDVVGDAQTVVAEADILCTATSVEPGRGPVFADGPHRPWLHVNAVGADLPGKTELPLALLSAAVVVPDHVEQCLAEGEAQQLDRAQLGPDLVTLVRERERHVGSRRRPTVFDSTGWALEDLVVAEMMLHHAERRGVGIPIDLQPLPSDPYDPYELLRRSG